MAVRVDESLDGIDWVQAKADLAADDFDNGRSPQALRASFEQSQHVAMAWDGDRVVGMARLLSDGVCNAYLLDVWTMSAYRRQGIGTTMVRQLMSRVPGQHIGLQTEDAEAFYASLGYHHQPVFMSAVAGEWLANEANARLRAADGVIPSPVTATVPGEDGIQRGAVASWRYPDLVTARRLNWASLPGYDFSTGRGNYNCHDQPAFNSTAGSSRLTRWGRHTRRGRGHDSRVRHWLAWHAAYDDPSSALSAAEMRDIRRTVQAVPALGRAGATVIWTRHRRPPDLTPQIRAWFAAARRPAVHLPRHITHPRRQKQSRLGRDHDRLSPAA